MSTKNRVYQIVKKIPRGKVATYGQIAKLARGINPRYVGSLLHRNPDPKTVPCHRVVNAKGMLADSYAFGGAAGQEKKLAAEHVIVKQARVDLSRYLWKNS